MENEDLLRRLAAPTLTSLAPAYVAAWGEIGSGVVRNANNPHFGNNYADLGACCSLVKPILAKYGLAFIQAPGDITNDAVTVVGLLLHTSGESVSFKTVIPIGQKMTAQSVGSAITYGRRYQLKSVFGLADKDDDGEEASRYSSANSSDALDVIAAAKTLDELEAKAKPLVEQSDDESLRQTYLTRRKELKTKRVP